MAHPLVVVCLILVNPGCIIGQNLPVLGPQALVVRGFAQRIDHIIDRPVVPHALIQLGLQAGQFLLSTLKTASLLLRGGPGAVNMIQVVAHLHEDMRVPITPEIVIPVMPPIL